MAEPTGFTYTEIFSSLGALLMGAIIALIGIKRRSKSSNDSDADKLRLLVLQREIERQASEERAKFYARIEQFSAAIGESLRALETRIAAVERDVLWLQATSENEEPAPKRRDR